MTSSFKYAAKSSNGKTVEGTIEAPSRGEALSELRKQNLVVLKVEASSGGGKSKKGGGAFAALTAKRGAEKKLQSFGKRGPKVKRTELVLFTRQLATMISSGLALLESIDVLADQAETPAMKAACARISQELRGGSDLSSAMETCPRAFSELYVSMVRAGEASGQMDVIMERLADYLEASAELTREIRSAMTYPVISMVLVIGITGFLMLGVVPTFRQVFESLDSELPAITAFVLGVSEWMRDNWMYMFGAFMAVMFSFMAVKKTKKGRYTLDYLYLKAPVFGPLVRKVALARFSRTCSTLIRPGVPIMGTLDIVAVTAGNDVVSRVVELSNDSVRNGQMLSEPLSQSPVFPPMVTRMIAIGERTGALEALLEKIAEFYDSQVKAAVKSMTSLIEPLLITFMGLMVGCVVLAVFLPILDVVGKLSGN